MRARVEVSLSALKYNAEFIRKKVCTSRFEYLMKNGENRRAEKVGNCNAEKGENCRAENGEFCKEEKGEFCRAEKVGIWWVVKADGYGHGAEEIVKRGLYGDGFCVATAEEGCKLRSVTDLPILVLGKVDADEIKECVNGKLSVTVTSDHDVETLNKTLGDMRTSIDAHIAVNTGMNRIGINSEISLYKLINSIKEDKNIQLKGVFSHLSDVYDQEKVRGQKVKFENFSVGLPNELSRHFGASGAIGNPNLYYDAIRVGAGLYGYGVNGVKPCMSVYGKVVEVNFVLKGESVGYGKAFVAEKDCTVATLSLGYADGVSRARTGGFVLIGGKRRKLIGSVCMDFCFAEVDKGVKVGDEVVFMGRQGQEIITATDIAEWENTVFYEVLTNVKRVKRIYI